MKTGRFRHDLYFRLNGIPLTIAPLRNRREDIVCLTEHFLSNVIAQSRGRRVCVTPATHRLLEQYSWPGNGRELLHVLERAVFSMTGDAIKPGDLPDYLQTPMPPAPKREGNSTLKTYMRTAEKQAIEHALAEAHHNKTIAADMLGIHRTLLYRKMQQLGMLNTLVDTNQ
jgi:transcriptional regulator with PAS, ATPase and Fis domain